MFKLLRATYRDVQTTELEPGVAGASLDDGTALGVYWLSPSEPGTWFATTMGKTASAPSWRRAVEWLLGRHRDMLSPVRLETLKDGARVDLGSGLLVRAQVIPTAIGEQRIIWAYYRARLIGGIFNFVSADGADAWSNTTPVPTYLKFPNAAEALADLVAKRVDVYTPR